MPGSVEDSASALGVRDSRREGYGLARLQTLFCRNTGFGGWHGSQNPLCRKALGLRKRVREIRGSSPGDWKKHFRPAATPGKLALHFRQKMPARGIKADAGPRCAEQANEPEPRTRLSASRNSRSRQPHGQSKAHYQEGEEEAVPKRSQMLMASTAGLRARL